MSTLFPVPDNLRQAEYVQLIFHLESRGYFDLPPFGQLRMRREFQQALRCLQDAGHSSLVDRLNGLLEPSSPDDLKLRKLVQRPAPALVLHPDLERSGLVEPGDRLELPVLFLGSGIMAIDAFALLLQQVGHQGLVNGQGQCDLTAIEVEDASGQRSVLWDGGPLSGRLTPVVNDLGWWLELQAPEWDALSLRFVSPVRLMRGGKPLFKTDFVELFPFILRRVSAMLAAHCRLDTVSDPTALLKAAARVEVTANRLQWRDWKSMASADGEQDLGGLCGSLDLVGGDLAELLWVLRLGTLLQIGKGAPYGAGRYQISRSNS